MAILCCAAKNSLRGTWPMPLFNFILGFLHCCRYQYIGHTLFFASGLRCGGVLKMTGSLLGDELSCFALKSAEIRYLLSLCHAPVGLEPLYLTSVALTA
jgi:hypothetical protein